MAFSKGSLGGVAIGLLAAFGTIAQVNADTISPLSESIPTVVVTTDKDVGVGDVIIAEDPGGFLGLQSVPPSAVSMSGLSSAPVSVPAVPDANCGVSATLPPEITTLAFGLKCNIDLIFEYVRDNIAYIPMLGSKKGPLGTFLDRSGNDFDQAGLFVALLKASGYSESQINYRYGYRTYYGTQAANWLGVADDIYAINGLLRLGYVPMRNLFLGSGDSNRVGRMDIARVWVDVEIDGTTYAFDPSHKTQTVEDGVNGLDSVLGYSRQAFLSLAGGTASSRSVSGLNRASVRSELVAMAQKLEAYIQDTTISMTPSQVYGGKRIEPGGSVTRHTILSNLAFDQPEGYPLSWGSSIPDDYRTCFAISMPGVPAQNCDTATSQTITLYADETYGKRITIQSVDNGNGTYTPTLLVDGVAPANGQNTGTAAALNTKWSIAVATNHPYPGSPAPENRTVPMEIRAGGTYLLNTGWGGGYGRGMIEYHRQKLDQAIFDGASVDSEEVVGLSLAVVGSNWLAQVEDYREIGARFTDVSQLSHHSLGIVGLSSIQGQPGTLAPYIDVPANHGSVEDETEDFQPGLTDKIVAYFLGSTGALSALESAVLKQSQSLFPIEDAVSTIELIDRHAGTGGTVYLADGRSAAGISEYFNTIRPSLTGYNPTDLSSIDSYISSNGTISGAPTNYQVLLPQVGNQTVGQWTGTGYSAFLRSTNQLAISQKISGGLSGGFSGRTVSYSDWLDNTYNSVSSTGVDLGFVNRRWDQASRLISDPVDSVSGAFVHNRTDLTTGSGEFPYALSFDRIYSSGDATIDRGLGYGWSHNGDISVSRHSNPFMGLREGSALSSAVTLAGWFVLQDLMQAPLDAKTMTVAWMVVNWMTDQLTHNAVSVNLPGTSEVFTARPYLDGAQSITYVPPPGVSGSLTGDQPNATGQPTVFTYRSKDQAVMSFTGTDSDTKGKLSSWQFPNGMRVDYSYDHDYDEKTFLTKIESNIGRSLSYSYADDQLVSVTDDGGRAVRFSYDADGNLETIHSPLNYPTIYRYDGEYRMTQVFYPEHINTPFFTNIYDPMGRVRFQDNAYGQRGTFYLSGTRSELIDVLGNRSITYQNATGHVERDFQLLDLSHGPVFRSTVQQNGVVNVTKTELDGFYRPIRVTFPEGGTVATAYAKDLTNNVVEITETPKPGSDLPSRTTRTAYESQFNKPALNIDPLGRQTEFHYDGKGNLIRTVDHVGGTDETRRETRTGYNAIGLPVSVTDPLGMVTTMAYDGQGNPVRTVVDTAGLRQTTQRAFNAWGDPIHEVDPLGRVTTHSYDAARRLIRSVSPPLNGFATTAANPAASGAIETRLTYDRNDNLLATEIIGSDGSRTETRTRYTVTGKPEADIDANGNETRHVYDGMDRLISTTDSLRQTTVMTRDALGRVLTVSNQSAQPSLLETRAYTPDGQLASITNARGKTTTYSYDGFNRLSQTVYPGSGFEQTTYDAVDNPVSVRTRAGHVITMAYDDLNRMTSRTVPAAFGSAARTTTYQYDALDRVVAINDNSPPIAAAAPPTGPTVRFETTYAYDALNRPVGAAFDGVSAQTAPTAATVAFAHRYDGLNRRIGQTTSDSAYWDIPTAGASIVSLYGDADQLTQWDGQVVLGNANDAVTQWNGRTLTYDAENRLRELSASGVTASYDYDPRGWRKSATVNGGTTVFVTDEVNREILSYDGASGQILTRSLYGAAESLTPVALVDVSGNRLTPLRDIQGSVIGALASDTGVVSKAGYGPFGQSASASGPGSSGLGQFGYTGHRFDAESGFYYARARMYVPELGRFLQPDPIGYEDGLNMYAYVSNDPLNHTDPSGLWLISPHMLFGAAFGFTADAVIQYSATGTYDWRQGLSATLAGAVTGGFSGIQLIKAASVPVRAGATAVVGGSVAYAQTEAVNAWTGQDKDSTTAAFFGGLGAGAGTYAGAALVKTAPVLIQSVMKYTGLAQSVSRFLPNAAIQRFTNITGEAGLSTIGRVYGMSVGKGVGSIPSFNPDVFGSDIGEGK